MGVAPPLLESRLAARYWLARWEKVRTEDSTQQTLFLQSALAADGGRGTVHELVLRCLADPLLTRPAMAVLARWRPPSGMKTDDLVAAWLKRLEGTDATSPFRAVVWQALAVLDGGKGRLASHLLEAVTAASEDELPCFLPLWRPAAPAHRKALADRVARQVERGCLFPSSRCQSLLKTVLLELDAGESRGFIWLHATGQWKPSHAVDESELRKHLDRLTKIAFATYDAVPGWQGRLLIDRGRGEWVSAMAAEVRRRPVCHPVLSVLSEWQPQPGVETRELAAAWWELAEKGLPPADNSRFLPDDPPAEVLLAWQALVNLDMGQGTHLEVFYRAVSSRTPWRVLKIVAEWKPASDEVEVGPLRDAWINLLKQDGAGGFPSVAFDALLHLERGRGWLAPLFLEWFPVIENHEGLLLIASRWEPRPGDDPQRQELISCWRKLVSHTYVTHACAAWEALFRLLGSEEEILTELAGRLPVEWRDRVLRTMQAWWPVHPARQEECFRLWAAHLGDMVVERRMAAFSVVRRRLGDWIRTHPHLPEVLPELLPELKRFSMPLGNWLRQLVLAHELGLNPEAAWYPGLGSGPMIADDVMCLLAGLVDWKLGQCLAGGAGPVGLARCLEREWLAMEEGLRLACPNHPVPRSWRAFWQPFLAALGVALGEGSGVEDGLVAAGVHALAAWAGNVGADSC